MTDPSVEPVDHPRLNDDGRRVRIDRPTKPSGPEMWKDPTGVAVFAPDCPIPPMLNDVPVGRAQPPTSAAGWAKLAKAPSRLPPPTTWGKVAAGAVVIEPDGRVWLSQPTNGFGDYHHHRLTFPKGTQEGKYSLEATAAKEVFEETGLLIEVGAFLADRHGDVGVTRFFWAQRIGGAPNAMGWETQGVWLVPLTKLREHATHPKDAKLVEAVLGARKSSTSRSTGASPSTTRARPIVGPPGPRRSPTR